MREWEKKGKEGRREWSRRMIGRCLGRGADLFAAALMFVGAFLQRTYCFWGR